MPSLATTTYFLSAAPRALIGGSMAIDQEQDRRRIGRSLHLSDKWHEFAEYGEVMATCWIPEDQILVHIRPSWRSWQIAAVIIRALTRVASARPKLLVFVGAYPDSYHTGWLGHLRCLAVHCGVGTHSTRRWKAKTGGGTNEVRSS